MSNCSVLRRLLSVFALAGAFAAGSAGAAQSADGYVAIDPPHATATGERVEVLEFFQYGCPHCRAMEPLVEAWQDKQQDDVALQRVPVAFNAAMEPWQRLYYTLEGLDKLELQQAVFSAVQTERNPLNSRERVIDWAAKQGLDKDKFAAMYDSFGVGTKVNRANQLIKSYSLQSVPTLVVDGRYMTSPALANGYQESLDKVDELIAKARSAR
ncbi:thiol:disulfide interchange protein DsbA/DsbL [Verticiella sediminum]|nr:thiol:disulfide interchange protein DsbA/DsbL [Verticiella sediminum]